MSYAVRRRWQCSTTSATSRRIRRRRAGWRAAGRGRLPRRRRSAPARTSSPSPSRAAGGVGGDRGLVSGSTSPASPPRPRRWQPPSPTSAASRATGWRSCRRRLGTQATSSPTSHGPARRRRRRRRRGSANNSDARGVGLWRRRQPVRLRAAVLVQALRQPRRRTTRSPRARRPRRPSRSGMKRCVGLLSASAALQGALRLRLLLPLPRPVDSGAASPTRIGAAASSTSSSSTAAPPMAALPRAVLPLAADIAAGSSSSSPSSTTSAHTCSSSSSSTVYAFALFLAHLEEDDVAAHAPRQLVQVARGAVGRRAEEERVAHRQPAEESPGTRRASRRRRRAPSSRSPLASMVSFRVAGGAKHDVRVAAGGGATSVVHGQFDDHR